MSVKRNLFDPGAFFEVPPNRSRTREIFYLPWCPQLGGLGGGGRAWFK